MADDPAPMVLRAHAKVNLFLNVGDRRVDGYHDVMTVLTALELADVVVVTREGPGIRLECDPDPGVATPQNLAYLAALAWFEDSGVAPAARIRVLKGIPAGAGLGGGSADAAAVLAALSGRHPSDLPVPERLRTTAARLGADVPFFLGAGTQLLGGRGDELLSVLPTPALDIVLIHPGVPVGTGVAYAKFDRLLRPAPSSPDAMVAAVRSGDPAAIAAALHNDMTEASCALVPEVAVALRFLRDRAEVLGSAMAGSGSTVFGVCTDASAAEGCADAARERGWWACATRTAPAGITWLDGPANTGAGER